MIKAEALLRLRAREADLRALGIERLSMFGSTARDEAGERSDVDLAVVFARDAKIGLFKYAVISEQLESIVCRKIDLVCEPAAKARVQSGIEKDRVHVF